MSDHTPRLRAPRPVAVTWVLDAGAAEKRIGEFDRAEDAERMGMHEQRPIVWRRPILEEGA